MSVAPVYGPVDPAEALATLHHAVDIGITFIDTANVYGEGASERAVGELLKDRRGEVQLATKFGLVGNIANGQRGINGDPAYVPQALDESLGRLGVDHVDLYYLHRVDPNVPIEDTVGAIAEQVKAGKVRNIGLSEATGDELRRAYGVHPIAAIQSEWSIWSRDVENKVVPTAAELGVGFVPFSPVGRGFLAGSFDAATLGDNDLRRRFPASRTPRSLPIRRFSTWSAPSATSSARRLHRFPGMARCQGPSVRVAFRVDSRHSVRCTSHRERRSVGHRSERRPDRSPRLLAAITEGFRSADLNWVSQGRE
ncbi:aldo/keto reductase [Rhodococcus baikonurensis]